MRRKSFDLLVSIGGALLALVLVAAGALMLWGYTYANHTVTTQLSAQEIYFPTKAELAQAKYPPPGGFSEVTPEMVPYLEPYAGQQLITGAQAETYANHFIGNHLEMIGGGKTYSQLSAEAMALPKGSAAYTSAEATVQTMFQGTTLRSMLLNAYGWWQMGQIALYGAVVAWALALVTAVLTVFGVRHYRRAPVDEEIPRVSETTPKLLASNGMAKGSEVVTQHTN
ncbi:MAG TPA: hypothetical protein VEJ84_22290 [Acidimicrobiales bacterium]|nr:hypothetical protein [Acidimicrobiales bacterium]